MCRIQANDDNTCSSLYGIYRVGKSTMTLSSKHFSLTSTHEVIQICKPLFDATEITNVYYSKMFDDGRTTALVTNPYFHKHFWEHHYDNAAFPLFHEGIILTEFYGKPHAIDAKNFFNMEHIFFMTKRQSNHYEVLGFMTYAGNDSIVDFYFNNLDLLENFGLYFKEKAEALIIESDKSPIIAPNYDAQIIKDNTEKLQIKKNELANLAPKYYTLQYNSDNISITRKEYLTLMNVAQGRTAKEIAKIHHVSNRTIENRLAKLKNKLGCNAKSQLVDLFFDNFKP